MDILAQEIASEVYCADAAQIARDCLTALTPPERISTVDCAEKYRKLPGPEGGTVIAYDRWRTPYNVGPMNALDDPKCQLVVMVKPSRSGGTTVGENFIFKMVKFGPMGHVAMVLESDDAVRRYVENVVKPMFDLNPDIAARIDPAMDNDSLKRIAGYPVEWLAAKDSTFRNREPMFMWSSETDGWKPKYAATPVVQIDGRQKQLGNRRKGLIESHPDRGFGSGVAAAYEDTSRGIYVMRCPECIHFAAAYATKHWPETPSFRLDYQRSDRISVDDRLALAERTAGMLCPHCGSLLSDEQRHAMIDEALREGWGAEGWMHRGQSLDPVEGIQGAADEMVRCGFWVHGLMLKTVGAGKLARDWESARIRFERTKDVTILREFMSKQLGEVFEGAASLGGLSSAVLQQRARESEVHRRSVPSTVKFITAAVDPGKSKFDVAFTGWDLEGRSWLLDRITIRQRLHSDGELRDLSNYDRAEDWLVLQARVVERTFEIEGREGWHLPVAVVCVDNGDGNVTEKARWFARRMDRAGHKWGGWAKVKLIKGVSGKRPILPPVPRKIDRDENGRPVQPVIYEHDLGVDALKRLTWERLAIEDGSPGQCHFARAIESKYLDEFFGEAEIDGKFVRSGPNETLDLAGYCEAGRLMLQPNRADIRWHQGMMPAGEAWREELLPPWARPFRPEDMAPPPKPAEPDGEPEKPLSRLERFARLNGG